MKVKVTVFATLREKLGWSEKVLELSKNKATIKEILEIIGIKDIVMKGDKIREDFIVLVNGINVKFLNDADTEVKDGDEVSIFPPAGGG